MLEQRARDHAIWWFAFGYFASYAPYSGLTKAITRGLLLGPELRANQFAILPISVTASLVSAVAFLTVMGWWPHASHRRVLGFDLPVPTRWTALSGVCSATIIMTTTLAYTFDGVSIVFMMLLMRGGVLVIAPITDFVARRRVQWYSWVGLGLSVAALLVADLTGDTRITLVCALDVAAYLGSYFVRLRFMSRLAKSEDARANTRYFVEEQLVSTPSAFLFLALVALLVPGAPGPGLAGVAGQLRVGFVDYWSSAFVLPVLLIGLLSQGNGIFGALILLDRRENTFCVPVNRTSSILAGVLASFCLAWVYGEPRPPASELAGAALVVSGILVLTIAPAWERARARSASAAATRIAS
jgi:hypothetical protein